MRKQLLANMKQLATDSKNQLLMPEIEELHANAYADPATGYSVMTSYFHRKRSFCCGNGCRHCPYGHYSVSNHSNHNNNVTENVLIRWNKTVDRREYNVKYEKLLMDPTRSIGIVDQNKRFPCDILFWSGGKDSYMAYKMLSMNNLQKKNEQRDIVLLTTFDPEQYVVPHQNIPFTNILKQQSHLKLDLIAVPLPKQCDNDTYIQKITSALAPISFHIDNLVFGDIHLQDIRKWREDVLLTAIRNNLTNQFQLPLHDDHFKMSFPLFGKNYDELSDLLFNDKNIDSIVISASNVEDDSIVKIGDVFDINMINKLKSFNIKGEGGNSRIDCFGENGEFHTLVKFK